VKLIQGIDFFYYDQVKGLTVLGHDGFLFGAQQSSAELLSLLCEANGRSVIGSMELFAKVNQAHQKLAVLVCPSQEEIYFPTHASNNPNCIWVNYGRIQRIEVYHENQCLVHFKSGTQLAVSCSARVVSKQRKRCANLLGSLCNPYEQINDLFSKI
jgi:competence transcription factor ComK